MTLLRESSLHSGLDHDLKFVNGEVNDETQINHAAELIEFAELATQSGSRFETGLAAARQTLRESVGESGLVDAAATVAIFDAVVRVADATGIPLEPVKEESSREFRQELGINDYRSRL